MHAVQGLKLDLALAQMSFVAAEVAVCVLFTTFIDEKQTDFFRNVVTRESGDIAAAHLFGRSQFSNFGTGRLGDNLTGTLHDSVRELVPYALQADPIVITAVL